MKYYKELAELGCFSHNDLARIVGSNLNATSLASSYLKKGYIERVRRNLYVTINMATGQPISNRFQIATCAADDAYVSHHSAFEFYGYANQVFYEVYFTTTSRARDFEYDGLLYRRISSQKPAETKLYNNVRVSTIERTVIDSISDFEKIGGLEETLRCVSLIPHLDPSKLLSSLSIYKSSYLYQKAGYILESLNDEFLLPDGFFEECMQHISNSKMYLSKDRRGYVLNEKWRLFAPADLKMLLNKGVLNHDAI